MEYEMPAVDVVIPTLRTEEEVQPQIDEIVRTAGCPVRVFASCTKASSSVNRNICLDWAESPVLVMLDDDIEGFPMGWVVTLVEAMCLYEDCVMCSPRLMNPNGSPGIMVGFPREDVGYGYEVLRSRELVTACIALRNDGTRFDEAYRGSGFEDNDFSRQLRVKHPNGLFIVIHHLLVIHRNEKKYQHGENWTYNQNYYRQKWGS